ncbi:MAG: ABC transporter ATP-binding protein [Candidatus Hydrogenedentota bacterium]
MNRQYLIELDGVAKTFLTRHFFFYDEEENRRRLYHKKWVTAADDITLGVKPGEIFGLLGPNGAGKTTAVKMISGLVRPDRGHVYIAGRDVERQRKKVLQKVGVVLEGTRTSMWPLTPIENLAYYGNLKNVRGRVLKERSHQLLDFIGLHEKKHVQVRRLSRGQKQKLAICIALIADPQVILLDEPTTGLDVQSSRSIKDRVTEMTRQLGKGVLVTTHDMAVAQELCDRIGIIHNGKLIQCKPTDELLDLFSDQVFVFRIDRNADETIFDGAPGVISAVAAHMEDGPTLTVTVAHDPEQRSAALYAIIERLRAHGYQLHSVNQRQQTLENVFLQVTGSTN